MYRKKHWTEKSIKDFLFAIASDFVDQLEAQMELLGWSQARLAKQLGVSKGRVSQIMNNPGNLTLNKIIEYARALGLKVAIVAYDDGDRWNERGPINSEVFRACWNHAGKPTDFWSLEKFTGQQATSSFQPQSVAVSEWQQTSQVTLIGEGLSELNVDLKSTGFLREPPLAYSPNLRNTGIAPTESIISEKNIPFYNTSVC